MTEEEKREKKQKKRKKSKSEVEKFKKKIRALIKHLKSKRKEGKRRTSK